MEKKAKRMYDSRQGRKSMRYGCMGCMDYGSCKVDDPCKYAAILEQYPSYSAYLLDKDPVLLDDMEEKSKAKAQKWKEVHMVLKNMDTGETYRHVHEAAVKIGCPDSNIYNHLCGAYSHIHGYHLAWVPA